MPRSVKDCDEDLELKIGRRTRGAIGNLVTDSPVRRSNRNKVSTKQTSSSPEINIQSLRAGSQDSNTLDTLSLETQPKKITRRSLAATLSAETSKANTQPKWLTRAGSESKSTPSRSTRKTRAGSESKSTPSRSTRKTRASSMDPDTSVVESIEEAQSKIINTPIKVKRRASILPSQSTLVEEEEKIPVVELEKMLIEVDETPTELITSMNNKLESPKNKSFEKIMSTDKIGEENDLKSEIIGRIKRNKRSSTRGKITIMLEGATRSFYQSE